MADDKKVLAIDRSNPISKNLITMDSIKKQKEDLDRVYKENEEDVKRFIKDNKVDEVTFEVNAVEDLLSAMIYDRATVAYDQDKLKAKLNQDQWKEVTDEIFIVSKTGLNAFIKAHPELKDELKQFITKSVHLNEKKLDIAFEKGVFTLDQIKGCYKTNVTEVFKFSKKKRPKK